MFIKKSSTVHKNIGFLQILTLVVKLYKISVMSIDYS